MDSRLRKIASVQGSITAEYGVLHLPDGTSLDLTDVLRHTPPEETRHYLEVYDPVSGAVTLGPFDSYRQAQKKRDHIRKQVAGLRDGIPRCYRIYEKT